MGVYCKRGCVLVRTVTAASQYSVCKPSNILGNTLFTKTCKELRLHTRDQKLRKDGILNQINEVI